MIARLLLALIVIDPDARTIDPGDFTVLTSTTIAESTTTSETVTSTSTSSSSTSSSSTTTSTPTPTSTTVGGTTYYITPGQSIPTATNKLKPGDRLVFRDGVYPMTRLSCGDVSPHDRACNGVGKNLACGEPGKPIVLEAEHERRAHFAADGTDPGFELRGCKFIHILGLRTSSQDNPANTTSTNSTLSFAKVSDLLVQRNVAWRNNRCGNNHTVACNDCVRVLMRENEAWESSRHGFNFTGQSKDNVAQRNYINNNGRRASTASNCPPQGGPESNGFTSYPTAYSFFENNITESTGQTNFGYTNMSGYGRFPGTQASSYNTWSGNITANTFMGMKMNARPSDSRGPTGVLVQDEIAIQPYGFGFRYSVAYGNTIRRLTVLRDGGAAVAFGADDPAYDANSQETCAGMEQASGHKCSFTLQDFLILEGEGHVATTGPYTCVITHGIAKQFNTGVCTGSQRSTTPPASVGNTGTKCLWCRPGDVACFGTGLNGGNLGADPRCQFDRGSKTTRSMFGPDGQLTICGAQVPGVTDGSQSGGRTCANFAERWMNHKKDGTGCPLAMVACPG